MGFVRMRGGGATTLTNHEFRSTYAGGSNVKHRRMLRGTPRGSGSFMYEKVDRVPHSVDWRKKGAVTGVKNQLRPLL